jgi:hypothetical protein
LWFVGGLSLAGLAGPRIIAQSSGWALLAAVLRAFTRRPRYTLWPMATKKKAKKFRAVTAVKEMARERIGIPRPTQVVPDRKKKKKEKHKATLGKLLGDS